MKSRDQTSRDDSIGIQGLWSKGRQSAYCARIHMLWTARHSLTHRPLSFNVIREICSYLGEPYQPIAVLEDEVKVFDMTMGKWQQLCALERKIESDAYSSSTIIEANLIFVCGGGNSLTSACIIHTDNSAYLLERTGRVNKPPNMLLPRWAPGIIYDPRTHEIYVFGGGNHRSIRYSGLASSEKFVLSSSQWKSLPNMHEARLCFNPCLLSTVVYLCGGCSASVETYTPSINTFTSLPYFTLPEASSSTATETFGSVVVITETTISRNRMTLQHPLYRPWSRCTPVISEGLIFVVNLSERVCRGIDLETATVVKEVSY